MPSAYRLRRNDTFGWQSTNKIIMKLPSTYHIVHGVSVSALFYWKPVHAWYQFLDWVYCSYSPSRISATVSGIQYTRANRILCTSIACVGYFMIYGTARWKIKPNNYSHSETVRLSGRLRTRDGGSRDEPVEPEQRRGDLYPSLPELAM